MGRMLLPDGTVARTITYEEMVALLPKPPYEGSREEWDDLCDQAETAIPTRVASTPVGSCVWCGREGTGPVCDRCDRGTW